VEACETIVANSAARDDELWSSIDFDIFLQDMNDCRKRIQEIWAKAQQDPTLLGVAEVGKSSPLTSRCSALES
jgi:hypothetical protein